MCGRNVSRVIGRTRTIDGYLAKLGAKDVLLLEQGQLTCGATWHAAGLVGQMRLNCNMTRTSKYGIELYATLETETGQATG